MTPFQRSIEDYLRKIYRVEPTFVHGGKHGKLKFVHDGRPRVVTVAGSPSDTDAMRVKIGDLRRYLGPPPSPTPKRKTEDIMLLEPFNPLPLAALASTQPTQSTHSKLPAAKVAVYNRATEVGPVSYMRLQVLKSLLGSFVDRCIIVEQIDEENWKVRTTTASRHKFDQYDTKGYLGVQVLTTPSQPFGMTPADITEVDGALLVYCPIATRFPLATRKPQAASKTTHERWVAVLREIDVLEAETERRLHKVEGKGWEAYTPPTPPIRLWDE